jgi:hypothetical protein
MHKSIATIDAPQFINLTPVDINPLMSACEIKVMYVGANRNGTYMSKEVVTEMSKTLRGAPIVGYYNENKEDFADHGNQVIIDDEGVKFKCLTVPYGFVSPDAKVWFQNFDDTDDFGNIVTREYLMTTGYLWTGQFNECQLATKEGRPHSMELDGESVKGHWERNPADNMEYFIINDASFSKLCILGSDVEPCFEGSSVTAPSVSTNFTKMDKNFTQTLFTMMQELKFALQGEQPMENEVVITDENNIVVENDDVVIEPVAEAPVLNTEPEVVIEEPVVENDVATDATLVTEEPAIAETEVVEEPSVKENNGDDVVVEPEVENTLVNSDAQVVEPQENFEAKYTALCVEYAKLQNEILALQEQNQILVAFKAKVDDAEKDAMIAKFYYLSDEEKKDVIENKANYTVEEIESKLSVICVRNKVNFDLDNNDKNDINIEDVVTYTLDDNTSSVPAWITAVKNNSKK